MRIRSWLRGLTRGSASFAPLIVTALVAIILVYALAGTVVQQSENAAKMAENLQPGSASPAIFRLGPLFWALIGLGIGAAVVVSVISRARGGG